MSTSIGMKTYSIHLRHRVRHRQSPRTMANKDVEMNALNDNNKVLPPSYSHSEVPLPQVPHQRPQTAAQIGERYRSERMRISLSIVILCF